MDQSVLRAAIEELRLAAESIAEWCGDAVAEPLTAVDTLRCFADILSCLVAAVGSVNVVARDVEQLTRCRPQGENSVAVPAQLQERLVRLRGLTDAETWQELCPLVTQVRELADQLER